MKSPKYIRVHGHIYKRAELLIDEADWGDTQHVEVGDPAYDESASKDNRVDGYTDVEITFGGNKQIVVRAHWFVAYDKKMFQGKPYYETSNSGISSVEVRSPDAAEVFFTEDRDPSTKEPVNNFLDEVKEEIELAEADGKLKIIPDDLIVDWESQFDVENYLPPR